MNFSIFLGQSSAKHVPRFPIHSVYNFLLVQFLPILPLTPPPPPPPTRSNGRSLIFVQNFLRKFFILCLGVNLKFFSLHLHLITYGGPVFSPPEASRERKGERKREKSGRRADNGYWEIPPSQRSPCAHLSLPQSSNIFLVLACKTPRNLCGGESGPIAQPVIYVPRCRSV